ncbi:hypothetical protein [Geobacter sp.]|uniref:hypothetical protein n=1 Tax=Geobacter sp. TaxID=46610 RepID=UPI001ACECFDA|nr:hypothetical protein [Geobacter sp.]CAG0947449.1 hypothetical protein ANRL1_04130 [Anaerolineae bacterium]
MYHGRFIIALIGALIAVLGLTENVFAYTVNLNDFYKDPTVTLALDGSSAVIAEDSALSPVLLSNDPGLGDPNVILPMPGNSLIFDYLFAEPAPGNQDEFGAFLVDSVTGGSVGSAYEFFSQTPGSGTISFDLSELVGLTLGLQFQLSALPSDTELTSTVTISNVRVEPQAVQPVPEPGTCWLILGGLCGLGLFRTCRTKARRTDRSLRISSLN